MYVYADDVKIVYPLMTNIQNDLDAVLAWSKEYAMELNTLKCAVLHVGYNNPHRLGVGTYIYTGG